MNIKKRFMSAFVAVAMLASTIITTAFAAGPTIAVSSASGKAGETVDVTVSLENNTGITVMALNVGYDSNALELTNVVDAGVLGTQGHGNDYAENPYILYWHNDIATENITVNGTVATLTFAIKDGTVAGDYPIAVTYEEDNVYDVDMDNVTFSVENGKVTVEGVETPPTPVSGPMIAVSNATGKAGETVDVTVSLENNTGITVMALNVGYDSNALELTNVVDAGVLGTQGHGNDYAENPYILYWHNDIATENITVNGTVATLTFAIKDGTAAGDYPITVTYEEDNVYDVDMENVTFAVTNGKVTVEEGVTPPAPVAVTGVTLDKTAESLYVDEKTTLTATVAPANADNKQVIWTSSDETVATVADGVVTAVAAGTATITVTTTDGNFTATCDVTVTKKPVLVTGVTLDKTTADLYIGDTTTLTATVAPADADDKTVAWTSSNEAVATVADGVVTAVAAGTATISAIASNGFVATCVVTVTKKPVHVTDIELDKKALSLTVGGTEQLTAIVYPADADNKQVIWTSSDEAVAKVNANGYVTAVGVGTAVITATTVDGGLSATCPVGVSAATVNVTGVTLDKTAESLYVDEKTTLTATVAPANADNKQVIWTSSDETVATVNPDGIVVAVAAGTATITVKTVDGEFTQSCTVTVTEKPKKDFTGLSFADATFTYDGTVKSIAISGEVPAEATVTYEGNTATNAGTYNAKALVKAEGYNDLVLEATLTIEKKAITVSALTLEPEAATLDGVIAPDEIELDLTKIQKEVIKIEGTTATIKVTGFELKGEKKDNYKVVTASVEATATAQAPDKIETGDVVATTVVYEDTAKVDITNITALADDTATLDTTQGADDISGVIIHSDDIKGLATADKALEITVKDETGEKVVLTFNKDALEEISKGKDNDILIKVSKPADEALEDKQQETKDAIPAASKPEVYQLTIVDGNTDFGTTGTATVTLPYVKGSGTLVALWLKDDGTTESVEIVGYDDTTVTLRLKHFSEYLLYTQQYVAAGGGGAGTVKTNADGITARVGQAIGTIKKPTKAGYVFDGWYADAELTTKYEDSDKVKSTTTLYPSWKVDPARQLTLTIGDINATVFGEEVENDVAPIIRNDRTMLPIRFIAEALGATVGWDDETRTVTITGDEISIVVVIDEAVATVNGEEIELDSPAFIESDRTFLPLRFVAENLGAEVEWVEESRQVVITKAIEE